LPPVLLLSFEANDVFVLVVSVTAAVEVVEVSEEVRAKSLGSGKFENACRNEILRAMILEL
jgi:hypothetical protein